MDTIFPKKILTITQNVQNQYRSYVFSKAGQVKPVKKLSSHTSIDMSELPLGTVQILGHELLRRPLQAVVLHKPNQTESSATKQATPNHHKMSPPQEQDRTSGGKQSSAARRGTEKPPCVLVSEAVSVLQNMCGTRASRPTASSSSSPSP
jgi:hypothetical protein